MDNLDYKKLKVAVAGCGSIGKRHIRILHTLGVEDIRVFDSSREKMEAALAGTPGIGLADSYDDLLDSHPEVVFILTPTGLHIDMAVQALTRGCHVFLEKPLSVDLDGVAHLKELRDRTGLKVMVGFCFRYHQGLLRAKDLLSQGEIGRLISVRAMVGEHLPTVRRDYRKTYYVKYSGAFEMVHDLDLAIWYAGQPVKRSYGIYGAYTDLGFESPDNVELLLEFEDRLSASIHLDFYQRPRRRVMELVGTEGTILIDFSRWEDYTIYLGRADGNWEKETGVTTRDDMFIDEDLEFLRAVAEDLPVSCTIEEACKSLEVVLSVTRPL
ncbi:Gfo/Idh/MocA family protein [Enterocloster citroniae]|uniref:Dehydrogenase n=3 Tax=Enterocloster citroniae TaxID=358743 RepID=A0ABV2G2P9_9FIRM|nr:Gfo/Idh/MocA family oxidoreductase [Enterocloster citroniae]KMW19128.1 hypothetical protein HMPREF9470_02613 [[Clostridium] citroniae WAL-19142]